MTRPKRTKVFWTPVMLKLLREWYPVYSTCVVAGALELKEHHVNHKAYSLGLKKSEAYLRSEASGRGQVARHPAAVANRFQPGIVPWNKGKHVVSGGRSAETRFKKGAQPHTTLPIGSYRIVPGGSGRKTLVLEQKMNDLPGPNHVRWHPVHRLVWIRAHGEVPKGSIVVFRPGQRTTVLEEITVDRLECITRGENAVRNHPRTKSPELAKLVQLKGVITRHVNRIVREHEESKKS